MTEATLWARGLIRRERIPFAWVHLQDELAWDGARLFMRQLGADLLKAFLEIKRQEEKRHG